MTGRARCFENTFRFIDGLTEFNDCGTFEINFHEIYPSALELKKGNHGY